MPTQPIEPTPTKAYPQPGVVPSSAPAPAAGAGSLALRIALTMLGAAGLIVGSLLEWFRSDSGTDIAIRSFWASPGTTETFLRSAGFVTIVIGLLAILGLVPRSGWLTRMAGALGIAAAVLLLVQVYRVPGPADIADLDIGFWLMVAGSVIALIGGFFGTRYRVVYSGPPPVAEAESAP